MKIFVVLDGEKTKPIQSQTKPISISPQTCAGGWKPKLKKQTQFVPARIGVKSYMKGDYDNKPASGAEENKAKQTQFQGR